ncbi:MAG: hypothetical protein RML36_09630 [Anaerolineae bacterium]|nr:hypothetical protein [Anaerolineae bacterium]MDW8099725.1 hypothetical protein [Anaerolineae bacterium]
MASLTSFQVVQAVRPLAIDEPSQATSSRLSSSSSFADALAQAGGESLHPMVAERPPGVPNRWQSLRYLADEAKGTIPAFVLGLARRPIQAVYQTVQQPESMRLEAAGVMGQPPSRLTASSLASGPASSVVMNDPALVPMNPDRPLALSEYPQPAGNNGRGLHWIPTTSSSPAVVDRFVAEAQRMGVRWVTFLNRGTEIGANDYLVKRLVEAGIMPVMRIYTDAGAPIEGDLAALVRHYRSLGVHYFQLYNEPNLRVENGGRMPDVKRYLDLWLPAARIVAANGGLPGFGALSPQGDVDDLTFLQEALRQIKARGATDALNRAWLSVHNYGVDYLRVRRYDEILRQELGRSLPQIGTEGGVYCGPHLSEEEQVRILADAYRYMRHREPYYLAYTYWVIANALGGGHDPAWESQALFRVDGKVSPLVAILQAEI